MEILIGTGLVVFIGSMFALMAVSNPPFIVMAGLEIGVALIAASSAPEYKEPPAIVVESDTAAAEIVVDEIIAEKEAN